MTINKTSKCQKIRNSQTSSRIIVMMVSGTVVVFHSPIKCGQWNWTKLRYIGLRCIQIAQYASRPERLSVRNVRDTVRIATSQDAMVSFVCKKNSSDSCLGEHRRSQNGNLRRSPLVDAGDNKFFTFLSSVQKVEGTGTPRTPVNYAYETGVPIENF